VSIFIWSKPYFQSIKSFSSYVELKVHMEVHSGAKFKCKHCTAAFNLERSLKDHVKKRHATSDFNCGQCKEILKNKATLDLHVKLHTGKISECFFFILSSSHHLRRPESMCLPTVPHPVQVLQQFEGTPRAKTPNLRYSVQIKL
jgi:hypothetical protein